MDDKTKLKILEFWIANIDKQFEIPEDLKENIEQKDINQLKTEIETTSGLIRPSDYYKHAQKIRTKIKDEQEIELINLQQKVLQKQTSIQEEVKEIQKETKKLQEKQTEIAKSTKNSQIAMVIVTILLLCATAWGIWIDNKQFSIFSKVSERQIESMPIIKPEIKLFVKDKLTFLDYELAHPNTFFNDSEKTIETWNKDNLYLVLVNTGQTPAGYLNIYLENPYLHFPSQNIPYLGGTLTGNTSYPQSFEFWYSHCGQSYTKKDCNRKFLPKGITTVNVTISCLYCEKDIHTSFDICIYNESSNCDKF